MVGESVDCEIASRKIFLKRFNELMVSSFNTQAVLAKMEALYAELEPEIDQHLARWNLTRSKYDSEWATLRNIVVNRPEYMLNYIQETFSFTDEQMQSYFAESYELIKAYKATH